MTFKPGARLGQYEIATALGVGGMGEVYRARDTKLNRSVAIKVLPDLFASDPERLARFHREAQLLAALNHPSIAQIHGFEDFGGVQTLIMELVEGPTLADRLGQGPIPHAEAFDIARQIATALQTAHEQGIIHRDLKPANIKVRDDGSVKVLDFGLAKLVAPEPGGAASNAAHQSPTITTPAMTLAGVILGTAAYMSPEQAKGRAADKRSDVWGFGVVLYEMLSGRRAFEGEDVSDTLASVLKGEPDWNQLPANIPPAIKLLLQRCLAKDRRQRVADISTVLFVLNESANLGVASPAPEARDEAPVSRRPSWGRVAVLAASAMAAAAIAAVTVWSATRPDAPQVTRFTLALSGDTALVVDTQSRDLAISPDGRHIVYKGGGAGGSRLFVQALDQLEPRALAGTGTPRAPFLSADGQWVGFVDTSVAPPAVKKLPITGGPALSLFSLDGASRGFTWDDNDNLIFATGAAATGLQRLPAAGGAPVSLTTPNREAGENDHLFPHFLTGRQAVVFTITATAGGTDASQLAVLDLTTGKHKIVMRGGSQAVYTSSGHLVYAAAGGLHAVAFDVKRLEAIGTPVPVLASLATLPTGTAEFDISRDGTLTYVAGAGVTAPLRSLVWVDRDGREEAITAPARAYTHPRLSPDGTRVAVDIRDQQNDIWVWSFAIRTLAPITFDPGVDLSPVWTPDGRRLVFSSQAGGGVPTLFWRAADGSGVPERLTASSNPQRPSAISSDGKRLVFSEGRQGSVTDVMMLALDGERRVEALLQTPYSERDGALSPDGRWLAYVSNDSGQSEVSVRPFPDVNTGRSQVSTSGGTQPLWSRNGEELFYRAPSGAVMSVRVRSGEMWSAQAPVKVMEGPYYLGNENDLTGTFDVSLDGRRFLMIKEARDSKDVPLAATIVVVQNWFEDLKRLVPTTR